MARSDQAVTERIVDQPEVYETGVADQENEFSQLETDENSTAVETIGVQVSDAYAHFARRENEVAKFYVQRNGQWKIVPAGIEDETDLEKYHRLAAEVSQLLSKINEKPSPTGPFSQDGALSSAEIASNLEVLSAQLKAISVNETDDLDPRPVPSMEEIASRIEKLGQGKVSERTGHDEESHTSSRHNAKINRVEQRIKSLEDVLGIDEQKLRTLKFLTHGDNLTEATESLCSCLQYLRPDRLVRVNNDLDILLQKLDRVEDKLKTDPAHSRRAEIDHLCDMVTLTDKHRAMVPTMLHRLKFIEVTHKKAAEMASTITHLESVQDQIAHSVKSNEKELKTLKEVFARNIELIKGISADLDTRISAIN